MACKPVCRVCKRIRYSRSITFTGGNVVIDLPEGNYNNGEKYCIVLTDEIPSAATINAPVVFTINGGPVQYPLRKRNCAQVTACGIRTRTRYSVCVSTSATGGVFKMLGNPCCSPDNTLASINGTAPTAPTTPTTGGGGATE